MNTEKIPKKDTVLLQKKTVKGEEKGKFYVSKRTGLKYKRVHISMPEIVYRDILEEIVKVYGKPCPRKISELMIRAFYYYKNSYSTQYTKEAKESTLTETTTKTQKLDLDRIFANVRIPQTEKLKEKLVRVLHEICIDRVKEKIDKSIEECVLTTHQITSTQLESSIIKSIGHDPRTIESNVEAFVKSGLLLLQTQNPEKNVKVYAVVMNENERKEYLAKILSKPTKLVT